MSVETALFFETAEEIYARIFRTLRPRTELPLISVRFRKYANANSKIRLNEGQLQVSISDLLESAPAPVQEALASILLAKLFRMQPEQHLLHLYERYLGRAELRCNLQAVKRERGRKAVSAPQGKVHDLAVLFEELNAKYFDGEIRPLTLGWSLKASRTTLGHYDPAHHAIVVSKMLDVEYASRLLVEYVLYHEMLHVKFPAEHYNGRRRVHTPAFKAAEKQFREFESARNALRVFVTRNRF